MASSEVVVVATIGVKPEYADEVVERFAAVVEGSHAEEGCLTYALHRDKSDPARFAVVERWRSQEDLDAHFTMPHMATVAELADKLEGAPQVMFCEPIPQGDPAKRFAVA